MDFFSEMPPLLKGFWFTAIPASVIFLLQTVMTFAGTDTSDGTGADFDSDLDGAHSPFQLFSLRNLVNFLLGFGWSGVAFHSVIPNTGLLVGLSLAVGIAFVVIFFLIIRQMRGLAEDNSFRVADTINMTAEVYLAIPAQKSGMGKVLVSVRGSVRELGAVTLADKIDTGAVVKVTALENGNILIVEKI